MNRIAALLSLAIFTVTFSGANEIFKISREFATADRLPWPAPRIFELGEHLRSNMPGVKIDVKSFPLSSGATGSRIRAGSITANLVTSNLTVLEYHRTQQLPFTALGCLPVYYWPDNPRVIFDSDLLFKDKDPWKMVLLTKPLAKIRPGKNIPRNIIFATFSGRPMSQDLRQILLANGNMLLINLALRNDLLRVSKPTILSGYLFAFDLLRRPTKDLPILANLLLIDKDRCSAEGTKLLSHNVQGYDLPIFPGIPYPKFLSQEEIQFPEHYLTHLDAPNHFAISGATPQDISLGFQQAPCVKIPLLDKINPLLVTLGDVQLWETFHGREIPRKSYVFFNSGNARHWPDSTKYLKIDKQSNKINISGFDLRATRWLIDERNIRGLGGDSISTDSTLSQSPVTHIALAEKGRLGFENVGGLEDLPGNYENETETSYSPIMWCLLVHFRIEGGTGSPVAIFAHLLPKDFDLNAQNSGQNLKPFTSTFLVIVLLIFRVK